MTETLPDGYIVEINGQKFRTVNADQKRAIDADRAELARLRQETELLRAKTIQQQMLIETQRKQQEITEGLLNGQRAVADNYRKLYEGERALRERAASLIGKPSRLTRIFNHPVTRLALAIGPPLLTRIGGR